MKTITSFLTFLLPILMMAQEQAIESEITRANVYFNGAQVTRTATLSDLETGKAEFKLKGLETQLVPSSFQITLPEGVLLDQLHFENYFEDGEDRSEEIDEIRKELAQQKIELQKETDRIAVLKAHRDMLNENRTLNTTERGVSIEELMQSVSYYSKQLEELIKKQRIAEAKAEQSQSDMQLNVDILEAIEGITKEQRLEAQVKVTVEKNLTEGEIKFAYMVPTASWKPKYEIRMNGLNEPLAVEMKAVITQNSSSDWDDVELRLTSEDPFIGADRPELMRWDPVSSFRPKNHSRIQPALKTGEPGVLEGTVMDDKGQPIPFANISVEDEDQVIGGGTSNFDGIFRIADVPPNVNLIVKASSVGYSTVAKRNVMINAGRTQKTHFILNYGIKQEELVVKAYKVPINEDKFGASTTVTSEEFKRLPGRGIAAAVTLVHPKSRGRILRDDEITKVQYDLKDRQTIPSDDEEHTVTVMHLDMPAEFEFFTAPIERFKAYLMAHVVDWERFDLLAGEAGLHVNGTFVGTTSFDPASIEDTLQISFGTDSRIAVNRKKLSEETNFGQLSGKNTTQRSYELTLKNSRPDSIHITVHDQIPVSKRKDMDIDLTDALHPVTPDEDGILKWEVSLAPDEVWKTSFGYRIRCPNYLTMYLD